jgi:hypothetical protein
MTSTQILCSVLVILMLVASSHAGWAYKPQGPACSVSDGPIVLQAEVVEHMVPDTACAPPASIACKHSQAPALVPVRHLVPHVVTNPLTGCTRTERRIVTVFEVSRHSVIDVVSGPAAAAKDHARHCITITIERPGTGCCSPTPGP